MVEPRAILIFPKKGEQYFYIDKYYDVDSKHFWGEDDKLDAENVLLGNIYFTIEHAREVAKRYKEKEKEQNANRKV